VAQVQVSDDPRAAAPVVYSDSAPAQSAPPCAVDYTTSECAPAGDVAYDDAPVVETDWDYYPGVSLWAYDDYPYYYGWNWPYGWPYASYVGFGFGWPYYGFGYGYAGIGFGFGYFGYWHGGYWHHHGHWNGWGGRYAYDGRYPGPYRYAGHGRYWNSNGAHPVGVYHGGTFAADRSVARAGGAPLRSAGYGRGTTANGAPMRQALPSASYYAAARGANGASGYRVTAMPSGISRSAAAARPGVANARDPHWVTSMPSRGYAQSAYRSSAYASRAAGYAPARSYGYAGRPGAAAPVRGYSNNYSGIARGGSYAHAAPAAHYSGGGYSGGGGHSGGSAHGGGNGGGHSSGGGHSGSASHAR
jgi:hypothetical protein